MSTGFIGADDAIKKEITLDEVQPLLLQIIVIFDCDGEVVNKAGEDFNVYSSEPKLPYDNVAEQLKLQVKFNGEIKSEIIYVNESDSQCIEIATQEIKKLAEKYLILGYSDVNIEVYIPFTSYRSMYVSLLIWVLDVDNKYFSGVSEIGLEKIKFSNNRINITNLAALPLVSDASLQSISNSFDVPNNTDAQVAAVLCEYAYFICRKNESNELNKSLWSKMLDTISIVGLLKRKGITNRAEKIEEEVNDLEIIPKRWKEIDRFKFTPKSIKDSVTNNSNQGSLDAANSTLQSELLKWDALSFDELGWIGMCDHHIDWKDSLAYTVVKKIQEDADKRFTLIGSKGWLNRWFIFGTFTGFTSVLFVNETDRILMYCTGGSDTELVDMFFNGDWVTTNILQFICGLSRQYQQSVTNALILDRVVNAINEEEKDRKKPIKLLFIGHSLGGGLASNNAIVTKNRHAITFNAAGLNWRRVAASLWLHNREELQSSLKGSDRVHSFIIDGEILDLIQTTLSMGISLSTMVSPGSVIRNLAFKPNLTRAYSAPWTEHYIDSAISTKPFGKHGMINFIKPTEQILKINL